MSDSPDTDPTQEPTDDRTGETPDETVRTTRRNAAKFFAGIAGAVSLGGFTVTALTGMESGSLSGGPTLSYTSIYVKGTKMVDEKGNEVTVDSIKNQDGTEMTVFPEKKGGGALKQKKATTLLARFKPDQYKPPTNVKGTVKGYCAYSKVCTHEGCLVSMRAGPNNEYFHCPCHQSTYNPLEGCKVVGGPAPRPLPQLPIGLTSDGKFIIATGPFEGPIGPQ